MKLKYYLRGIAAGVLLSTCILTIFHSMDKTSLASETMTEEDIVTAAKQLGMVFEDDSTGLAASDVTTSGNAQNTQATSANDASYSYQNNDKKQENPKPQVTQMPDTTQVSGEEAKNAEQEIKDGAQDILDNAEQDMKEAFDVEIKIKGGMSSGAIAKILQDKGVLKDSGDFDSYITKNGYDKKLHAGNYTINSNDSYEQIANKLMGK